MKKNSFYGMMMFAAALLTAGCTADYADSSQGLVPIYLTATVNEGGQAGAATRAAADLQGAQLASGTTFAAEFTGSDVTENSVTYTADGSGGATGNKQPYFTFSGTSTTAYAYCPEKPGSTFSVSSSQQNDANYKSSDLMYATKAITKSGTAVAAALQFSHKMAKIICNVTVGSGVGSVKKVEIIGGYRTINVTDATTCTLGTTLTNALSDGASITIDSSTHSSGSFSCAAVLPPQTITGNFLKITTNAGSVIYNLDSKAFASGQSYTFNITVNAAAIGTTIAITNWANNGSATVNPTVELTLPDRTPPGVTLVDLGLPSGTKWASRNIGAISDTDYGLYFAWGDVIGRSGAVSSGTTAADGYSFSWTNTPYNYGSSSFAATKYNDDDGLTQLEPCDDAAYMNWGGKWRMPTQAEWEELKNTSNCTWELVSSPVAGYRVTSKKSGYTSNSIFLPAAGFRSDTRVYRQGSNGRCWSSTLVSGNPGVAYYLSFDSGDASVYGSSRYFGCSVRPVQSN